MSGPWWSFRAGGGDLRLRQQPEAAGGGPGVRRRLRLPGVRAGLHPPPVLPGAGAVPLGGAIRATRGTSSPPTGPSSSSFPPTKAFGAGSSPATPTRMRSSPATSTPADPASGSRGSRRGSAGSGTGSGTGRAFSSTPWWPTAGWPPPSSSGATTWMPGRWRRRTGRPRDEGRLRRGQRLAPPERPREHRVGRHLGQLPPRGRRGDRILPARGAGHRGRRHAGGGGPPGPGALERPPHRGAPAPGCGVPEAACACGVRIPPRSPGPPPWREESDEPVTNPGIWPDDIREDRFAAGSPGPTLRVPGGAPRPRRRPGGADERGSGGGRGGTLRLPVGPARYGTACRPGRHPFPGSSTPATWPPGSPWPRPTTG
jgi:hypothetical protein